MTPQFMIYVEGAGSPAVRYSEAGKAIAEAERLCVKERKRVFDTLQLVQGSRRTSSMKCYLAWRPK